MKEILLNGTQNDKTAGTSGVKFKRIDETRSFAASLKESCESSLNIAQSVLLPAATTKAPIIFKEGQQVSPPKGSGAAAKGAGSDCGDQIVEDVLKEVIPPDYESLGRGQLTPTLLRRNTCVPEIGETRKSSPGYQITENKNAVKNLRVASSKTGENGSEKGDSVREILTATNAMPTVVCTDEVAMRCYVQGGNSRQNISSTTRTEGNDGKFRTIAGNVSKSQSVSWTSKNEPWQETPGFEDRIPHWTKLAGVVASPVSKVLPEHQPDKSPNTKADVGVVAKGEKSDAQAAPDTAVIASKNDCPGMAVLRSTEGVTTISSAQTSNHSGVIAKEPRANQSGSSYGSTCVEAHESKHGNNSGGGPEPGPMLLGASSKAIEIGVASGTHGWLKIRAEIEHGVVTASVATKSGAVEDSLRHELPSLNAFLEEEKVGGGVVVVKQLPSTDMGGMDYGDGAHKKERSMNSQDGTPNDETMPTSRDSEWGSDELADVFRPWQSIDGHLSAPPGMPGSMSGWLNIRV